MESNVFVERNEVVERSATQDGYKITTNRKEEIDDIYVAKECSCTGDCYMPNEIKKGGNEADLQKPRPKILLALTRLSLRW